MYFSQHTVVNKLLQSNRKCILANTQGNLEFIEREAVLPWLAAINAGAGSDFCVHRNANNLAILPKTLNKARAVAYVRQILEAEHGEIITFGMGDSTSDARFMASCDYAIIPKGSQLAAHTVETL